MGQPDKAADTWVHCQLLYVAEAQLAHVEHLQALINQHKLSLNLHIEQIQGKLNQKRRQQLSAEYLLPVLLLDDKNQLSLLSHSLSVAPEWDKLQRRVVSAGRKTELILQAAKITADSVVIDATAGFGHDSLILASSGAQVIMLEEQPVMALLLLSEQQRMSREPNWQKLMARLQIINIDALSYFASYMDRGGELKLDKLRIDNLRIDDKAIDVVYLDPMFPEGSYQDDKTGKGAKVGKHMQALHLLARPPSLEQEQQLLNNAQNVVRLYAQKSARVIVKRPKLAPFFAEQPPDESWHNAAVRFDGYFI